MELVQSFPLTSIRSEAELEKAQKVMDSIFATGLLSPGAEVYLDALSDLVAAYEDVHHQIGSASDADMLRHFMEVKGVTQAEVSKGASISKSSISEILAGRKPFSRQTIGKLAAYFNVAPSILAANFSEPAAKKIKSAARGRKKLQTVGKS